MIDAKDQGTQSLDLGDAPKRRGRPSTGKALSNADRQRAYRERQKSKSKEGAHKAVAEDLRQMLAEQIARAELAEEEVRKLEAEVADLKFAVEDLARANVLMMNDLNEQIAQLKAGKPAATKKK
jgi:hypothetical protein